MVYWEDLTRRLYGIRPYSWMVWRFLSGMTSWVGNRLKGWLTRRSIYIRLWSRSFRRLIWWACRGITDIWSHGWLYGWLKVGWSVGLINGWVVGRWVGSRAKGCFVGWQLGILEGCVVGWPDGLLTGLSVGWLVG